MPLGCIPQSHLATSLDAVGTRYLRIVFLRVIKNFSVFFPHLLTKG